MLKTESKKTQTQSSWNSTKQFQQQSLDVVYVSSLFCLLTETMDFFEDTEDMLTLYLVFHLVGIFSTCTNPILYGFLNDNFKKVWGINDLISKIKVVNLHWSKTFRKSAPTSDGCGIFSGASGKFYQNHTLLKFNQNGTLLIKRLKYK